MASYIKSSSALNVIFIETILILYETIFNWHNL